MNSTKLKEKHKALLAKEGALICTSDGVAFYNTPQGKAHAEAYAAANRLEIVLIKADKASADTAKEEEAPKGNKKKK